MGSPNEMESHGGSRHTKATFSGMTALVGILALIVSIISVAVPHWGSYSPVGQAYFQAGYASQDNQGHFGPFQVCKYHAYYSYCGTNSSYFQPTTWLIVAGICAVATVVALSFFSLFAVLHVAMQLQRREIMLSFQKDVFLKLVASAIAVLSTVAAVILGGLEFALGGRSTALYYKQGVCYYLQIFLIFVNVFLVILSYLSYRKARDHPLPIVPKSSRNYAPDPYDNRYLEGSPNGVSMTASSGMPYLHGQPRIPIHPQPTTQFQHSNAISYGNGHSIPTVHYTAQAGPQQPSSHHQQLSNNGFTSVSLQPATVATISTSSSNVPQPLPLQPIRPIQPVQGIPQQPLHHSQPVTMSQLPQVLPMPHGGGGVSFTPAGRSGYSKMSSGTSNGAHTGSMESLDSTQSLTLSNYSFGSSTSTGSGHGPLRSSLKKPKNRDIASVSSKSSSKQVRISLGAEQTSV